MPEVAFVVARVRRRSLWRSIAFAVAIGGAVFALTLVLAIAALSVSRPAALLIALFAGVAAAIWAAFANRRLTMSEAAKAIEGLSGSLDNLVVTAVELDERPRPVRAEIRSEIERQAAERVRLVDPSRVVPLAQPIAVALLVVAGSALLASTGRDVIFSRVEGARQDVGSKGSGPFIVRVFPPSYTRRNVEEFANPSQITVIAGSQIRIEGSAGQEVRNWIANESEGLEISPDPFGPAKFLSVIVVPDAAPLLRVLTPGRDSAFAAPVGQVAINIEGGDDLGLASMSVRFTKASGGGENLAFTEGEVPLTIERRSERQWVGRANLALETLGLADGDILVYRALARDTNPRGTPVQSEQYLIEIGKNSQIADAGFSLPSEEKKYAISQQMVIYKTEQLLKSKTDGEGRLTEARNIAIEQRMVRAEVVFLGGGEVEDELEEAAKSDELTEGRMQNTGRAEMLKAITAMSRAEALLNEGRAPEALVFERQALASLERALDRRRYFLRTLPDRSRIDVTRRLTGARAEARSWLRDQSSTPANASIAAHRRLMQELVSAAGGGANIDASLAARVTAIDPTSTELQKAAVAIASASSSVDQRSAVQSAMQAVTAHALKTLPPASAIDVRRDALAGKLADELTHLRQGYGGQGPPK